MIGNSLKQAIIGGTASKITGNKFANGAFTAALQYIVNEATSLKRSVDVQEPKTLEPEIESIKRERVFANFIGDPPPGLKNGPDLAWRLVDSSVYMEYEVEYITTSSKVVQDTVLTQWRETDSGAVSSVGQRVTTEVLDIKYNTSIHITPVGIVGALRLPSNARIVNPNCISKNMSGC